VLKGLNDSDDGVLS